jgi:probable F420-dependent oxidoreductase
VLKIDVGLNAALEAVPERAKALESVGVDGIYTFENAHDVFFPLVRVAPYTELDLMTNVAMAFPRSPMHLAHAAYDLQTLSRGRFRLGLGSQIKAHIERRFGARWDKPVAQMRESVSAIKAILDSWQNGTKLDFRGTYTTHTLMTPAFNPGPNAYGVPKVLVGALGVKMNQMAAEVADGILVMPFNTGRHMAERTRPAIEAGLAVAGRQRSDLEVTAEVIVAVGRTDEELQRASAAKFTVGFYASTPNYRPVLEVEGLGELQPELNRLTKEGKWGELPKLITDDVFHRFAAYGTPKEAAAEIVRRYGDCDRICAYFPGYDISDELLAEFAAEVRGASSV